MSNMIKQPSVKQIYAAMAIVLVIAGWVGVWAVIKYRVDNHGVRIEKVETEAETFRLDYTEQMTRVETTQGAIQKDVGEIKKGIDKILERGGG